MPRICMLAMSLATVLTVFASFPAWHAAADEKPLSAAEKSQIEEIIHDYIRDNPQVILDAVRAHQEAQAEAEKARQQHSLVEMRQQLENAELSPTSGNSDGNVTVVEFFDYNCGYCKRVHDTVQNTVSDDGNVRLVYKEFPILGPSSLTAARAALGVFYNLPDKYIDYHNALMTSRGSLDEAKILSLAESIGLDRDAVKKHMSDPRIDTELRHNMALAEALGIQGTPAFVVDNTLVPGALNRESLEELIKKARGS